MLVVFNLFSGKWKNLLPKRQYSKIKINMFTSFTLKCSRFKHLKIIIQSSKINGELLAFMYIYDFLIFV